MGSGPVGNSYTLDGIDATPGGGFGTGLDEMFQSKVHGGGGTSNANVVGLAQLPTPIVSGSGNSHVVGIAQLFGLSGVDSPLGFDASAVTPIAQGGISGVDSPLSTAVADPSTLASYPDQAVVSSPAQPRPAQTVLAQKGTPSMTSSSLKGAIILGLLLGGALLFGQTDNTLYVKNFNGLDVGQKVTRAMASCGTNTAVPCILVIDPSLAAWKAGTLPSLCSHCYLQDWRNGPPQGSGAITGTLHAGFMPIATGPHSLADGPIDDGVFDSSSITIADRTDANKAINLWAGAGGVLIDTRAGDFSPEQTEGDIRIFSGHDLQGVANRFNSMHGELYSSIDTGPGGVMALNAGSAITISGPTVLNGMASNAPICAAGSGGALTNVGCAGGSSTAIDYYWTVASACTTGLSQPVQCTFTTTLPGAMPDTSYQVDAFVNALGSPSTYHATLRTDPLPTAAGGTLSFSVVQTMQNAGTGGTPTVYLHAHHD